MFALRWAVCGLLVCGVFGMAGCKHKNQIRAQIKASTELPEGFIESEWELVKGSGSSKGKFTEKMTKVCCSVSVSVKGTVKGEPFEKTFKVEVCVEGTPGSDYELDCSDPVIFQFPEDAKAFVGTWMDSTGLMGGLVVESGLSCVPTGPGTFICAEPGQQLLIVALPPDLPPESYRMRLDFGLDTARSIDVKAVFAGKVRCGDSDPYYPVVFPCVSTFTDVDTITIPMADFPTMIMPPLDKVDGCDAFISCDPPPCPDVLHVDEDATGVGDGSSWSDAFTDLQTALSRARDCGGPRDIWVAKGTYRPDSGTADRENSFALTSGVSIYGGFAGGETLRGERDPATNRTVLSGDLDGDGVLDDENSYHVVTATGVDATAILDGFVIEGGNANGPSDGSTYFWDAGGGLRCDHASPTIHDCDFSGNYGTFGGGVELFFGAPSFTHCTFTDNSAGQYGGGLHNNRATPTMDYCSFDNNSAGTAGGAARHIAGGGMYANVTFGGNSAGSGGALFLDKSSPKLINAVCRGNFANKRGGALSLDRGSSPVLVNLLLEGNSTDGSGGAINNVNGSPTVVNCTLTGNRAASGGGVYSSAGAPTLSSTILYFNEDAGGMDESAQITVGGGSLTLGYSNVQGITGGLGGIGNIDGDPFFLLDGFWNDNGTPGDWNDDWWTAADARIAANSPCIDAGDNAVLPLDDADLDSDTITVEILPLDLYGGWRQLDDPGTPDTGNGAAPLVDIGAAEFEGVSEHNRKGDSNGDGAIDFADIDCFVAALISKSDWMACSGLSGDRYVALNDVNGDGTVDFGDIDPFVDCLINGGCK